MGQVAESPPPPRHEPGPNDLTRDKWDAMLAVFKKQQKHPPAYHFVMHPTQLADLKASLNSDFGITWTGWSTCA